MNAYDFHRSIDFLIWQATEKILKAKSLEKSKYYFYSDFSNDSGIINLLRKVYIEEGCFEKTFDLYQNSRLEPKSYRYESLITLLIITTVGNLIGGILFDVYRTHKEKIIELFDENILKSIKTIPKNIQNKFIRGKEDGIKEDFKNLVSCYIARLMLEKQLISLGSYYSLVAHYIHKQDVDMELKLFFEQFMKEYSSEKNAINVDRMYSMIEAYSKGVFLKFLDEKECDIPYFDNIKTLNIIRGQSASLGAYKGKVIKGVNSDFLLSEESNLHKKILCMDGNDFLPMHLDLLKDCHAVVTWRTGWTGHLPLVCRSLKKVCIVIRESETDLLIDGDDIIVDGRSGIVQVGL